MNDYINPEWEQAKRILETSRGPENAQAAKYFDGGSHQSKGDTHPLIQYKLPFHILSFAGALEWSYCKDCKRVQHKFMVIYNNEANLVCKRDIIRKGEPSKYENS